jgi:hypothetical protein
MFGLLLQIVVIIIIIWICTTVLHITSSDIRPVDLAKSVYLWLLSHVHMHNVLVCVIKNARLAFGFLYNVFGTYPIKPKPSHVKRCV